MVSKGVRVVGCCRPGHKALSGWNDTVITVCETCSIIIGENRPAANVISLYEFIDSLPDFSFPDYKGERITLQDCYRAKARETEKASIARPTPRAALFTTNNRFMITSVLGDSIHPDI